ERLRSPVALVRVSPTAVSDHPGSVWKPNVDQKLQLSIPIFVGAARLRSRPPAVLGVYPWLRSSIPLFHYEQQQRQRQRQRQRLARGKQATNLYLLPSLQMVKQ
ncbi:unnamed protein product, partial [Pylaiella littoralis]